MEHWESEISNLLVSWHFKHIVNIERINWYKADSFDSAIANNTQYALTGGVYSRTPSHLEQARNHFQVGNLYLNRGIIGSIVARQPFGGFKQSGIGVKAGGPDYLTQFMNARVITENT